MVAYHRGLVEWPYRGDPRRAGFSPGAVAPRGAARLVIAPDICKRPVLIAATCSLRVEIDKLSDHVTSGLHPRIGRIKDKGSARGRRRTSCCHGDLDSCGRRTPRDSVNRLARSLMVHTGSGEESHICHAASGFSSGVGVSAISDRTSASTTIEVVGA